jgi:hypothetical protein
MTLTSILALLTLPLLKRPELASKKLPATLDPRIIENAALKAELTELKAQINDLKGRLDAEQSAHMWTRRDRDYWYEDAGRWQAHARARAQQPPNYGAMLGFQQQHPAQQVNQHTQAQLLQAYSQMQSAQQFAAQNQQSSWHDCTCVPGRAAAFGVLREDDQ